MVIVIHLAGGISLTHSHDLTAFYRFASTALKIYSLTIFAFGLGGGFFSVVERLVLVNADSYPAWLAKELDSPAITDGENFIKATESFEKICGKNKGYLSVVTKHNGIFMRCDDSLSFDSWWKGVYRLKTPETR